MSNVSSISIIGEDVSAQNSEDWGLASNEQSFEGIACPAVEVSGLDVPIGDRSMDNLQGLVEEITANETLKGNPNLLPISSDSNQIGRALCRERVC